MKQPFFKKLIAPFISVVCTVFPLFSIANGANIIGGVPGSSNSWDGITTNTIIKIDLDEPVAMIGDQPDMVYVVKNASFNGFDFVLADVSCDVGVSDDRMTIRLYPLDLADNNSLYAYKILDINFQGGGSAQNFTQCYATGNDPVPQFDTTMQEGFMCTDDDLIRNGWEQGLHLPSFYCYLCHLPSDAAMEGYVPPCIIAP